ncbi:MAG: alpha/beta fold hydrolase [Proteobacteria bacterium]|nr:alpha/beta fold hydrolase [Pseudomonadota bacterium]
MSATAGAPYRAPGWLRGSHAQTILPFLLPKLDPPLVRERVEIGDGDFWLFDWLATPAPAGAPVVVVFHGLEGGSTSHYARAVLAELARVGWRGVVPHFRGCGGEPNRLPRAYHSGDHAEIGAMLAAVRARVGPETPMYAVGVSLGGSALVNWVGRQGIDAARTLVAAAAVSTPLDLMAAGLAIARGFNKVYTAHFLKDLKPKALAMARRFPGLIDVAPVRRARSMWDFDDVVTSRLHGFTGVVDYWTRASSKPWLRDVALPTLVINARNDPFIPASSLPSPHEVARAVVLEQPAHGGHAGFPTGPFPGATRWLPARLLSFFRTGR